MDSEKKYLQVLMDAFRPTGNVLQVGYGNGYAAEQIQKFHPNNHIIIERQPEIARHARKWASGKPSMQIIEDTWEKALSQLGVFDAVFFNEPHGASHPDLSPNFFTSEMLKEESQLLEEISTHIPDLTRIRYLDPELEAFCQSVAPESKQQLARFLDDLEKNGQITLEQKKKMRQKHHLKEAKGTKPAIHLNNLIDPLLLFLKECLSSHMRKGGRFSCFSIDSVSKYEDSLFSEQIIVDPNLNYQEISFPVNGKKEALIILVEKTS